MTGMNGRPENKQRTAAIEAARDREQEKSLVYYVGMSNGHRLTIRADEIIDINPLTEFRLSGISVGQVRTADMTYCVLAHVICAVDCG